MKISFFASVALLVSCVIGVEADIMLQTMGSAEAGQAALFELTPLTTIVGSEWTEHSPYFAHGDPTLELEIDHGIVLRARNQRTGKMGGLLIWEETHDTEKKALAKWNPWSETISRVNANTTLQDKEWQPGDMVSLLDYPEGMQSNKLSSYTPPETGTHWDLPANFIGHGAIGVVGLIWDALEIEVDLHIPFSITGIWYNSASLQYDLYYDVEGVWVLAQSNCRGNCMENGPIEAKTWKLAFGKSPEESCLISIDYEVLGMIHTFPLLRSIE